MFFLSKRRVLKEIDERIFWMKNRIRAVQSEKEDYAQLIKSWEYVVFELEGIRDKLTNTNQRRT